jgi:prepilin-type N-terminal cleavage/methylation domain-containing protein
MNPRGVTLVELLAAISIVVVVTALSLPAVQSRLAGARLDAAQGQIEAAVIAARAEAVRAGKVMELFSRKGRKGEAELLLRRVERGASRDVESQAIGSLWCVLPGGMQVRAVPVAGQEVAATASGVKRPGDGEAQESANVRIAMFFPDGTAVVDGPVYLSDGVSDWAIAVNSWVGGAGFTLYTPTEDSEQGGVPKETEEDR